MTVPHIKLPVALRLANSPSYLRFGAAIAVGALTAALLPRQWAREIRLVASWDAFALASLTFTWFTILSLKREDIRRVARLEDPSRVLSLVLVILGALSSLLAVLVLLESSIRMPSTARPWAIVLALSAVVLAWLLIHTVFTLRYAHLYHGADEGDEGLDFPGDDPCPAYMDFAYFAFVVGMTAQTSDVGVCTARMRVNVLMHGVVSFAFNTAIVALSIGVLTSVFMNAAGQ